MLAELQSLADGLLRKPRAIEPKFFYDSTGSELFEKICQQPEYYPTRTELRILRESVGEIAGCFPPRMSLIELGSGASLKTRLLLNAAVARKTISSYVPVDISSEYLLGIASTLRGSYPGIRIEPLAADFTQPMRFPEGLFSREEAFCFLPGSTLGNFDPEHAVAILNAIRSFAPSLLIGMDLEKDRQILEAAYNDAAGITARFNKNLLRRLRDEFQVGLDPDDFEHRAFYSDSKRRIEMHLIASHDLAFQVMGQEIRLRKGESIHTENSYKYSIPEFARLAEKAGYGIRQSWTDSKEWFGVFLLSDEETGVDSLDRPR